MLPNIWINHAFEKIWIRNNIHHFLTGSISIIKSLARVSTCKPLNEVLKKFRYFQVFQIEPNRFSNRNNCTASLDSGQLATVVLLEFYLISSIFLFSFIIQFIRIGTIHFGMFNRYFDITPKRLSREFLLKRYKNESKY